MSPQARLFSIMQVDKTAQLIEQVRQLHRQSINALVATMAVLFYVAYRIRDELSAPVLWSWVGVIVAINLYLLVWIYLLKRNGLTPGNVRRYLLGYQGEALLHGTAWGMLPFLLAGANDPLHQLFAYYVICGMAAGAIATTGMIYRIYLSFMLTMLLPSIIWQISELGLQIFDMGAIGLLIIFVVAMLFLSHAHYDSIIKTIRLIQQNEELVESLRDEAQRAEAANRAKTEFLSNTSHELRTPLNAIMGFSSLLMKFCQQELPEKAREYVRNIHQAGSHLSGLINQVLDLAKIETDKVSVQSEAVNLKTLLGECLELMRPLAVERGVRLEEHSESCTIGGGADVYVQADPLRLRQVMINLISNAIKYNQPGGDVQVHCRVQDDRLLIEVVDSGVGIPVDKFQEIFTPFTRAHQHLNVEGTGIGLTVTKKNLELMGSRIQVESREGGGSRFWFSLPYVEAPLRRLEEDSAKELYIPSELDIQLLYVEDNPLGMRLMQEVMAQVDGITLHCAETGEAGYRQALELCPDVIILDINLPDISGMEEVVQRLRANPRTRNIPALALSASALAEDVERGLRAGFTEYLKKPCLPDAIVERVIALANPRQLPAATVSAGG